MDADLSLVSLSGMLDVSPNHLSACIKKYAGETFINILIRRRMEAARELLTATDLKIQEIAQPLRLHRPALLQLLLQKVLRRVPQRHAPPAERGEGG